MVDFRSVRKQGGTVLNNRGIAGCVVRANRLSTHRQYSKPKPYTLKTVAAFIRVSRRVTACGIIHC